MSVQSAGDTGGRTTSRVLASVPWIVVLAGVALLVVLLVMALLSFRGPEERQAVPPPAPPMLLPTPAAAASAYESPASASPTAAATSVARPTRTRSTPPTTTTSRAPVPPSPLVGSGASAGQVTARYEVTDIDRDSFGAELTVRNTTGGAQDWRVELLFTGDVRSIRVYGRSGVSVSADDSGRYVLRGTGPIDAGDAERFHLRISHDGADAEPDQCTVNGTACVIG